MRINGNERRQRNETSKEFIAIIALARVTQSDSNVTNENMARIEVERYILKVEASDEIMNWMWDVKERK